MDDLIAKLGEIDGKLDALLAHDELTDEQRAEHDALNAERAKTLAKIAAEESKLAREAEREELAARAEAAKLAAEKRRQAGTGRKTTPDTPVTQAADTLAKEKKGGIPATVKRHGSLKNFEGKVADRDADERAYRFGMWGLAMLSMQLPSRFNFASAVESYPEMFGSANTSKDANGTGYLIPEEFGTDMIILRERFGVARRLLKIVPMASDTRTDPRRKGGLTATFLNEGGAGTESNKVWDNVRLTAKDLMVLSRYTANVNADAVINFGDDLAGEISYAYSNKEDDCAFNGDGTSAYGHIQGFRNKFLNCDLAGSASAGLITGTGTGWSGLILKDFNAVVGALPQYADTPGAAWVCHRTFYYTVIEPLIQAAGGVTAFEVREATRKPRPIFQGYPVEFSQVFPSTSASGTVMCILGELSLAASFGDRQMDSIAFSEHASIGGENVFERNQIAIRGIERFDINVHDVGDATTHGPVTALKCG